VDHAKGRLLLPARYGGLAGVNFRKRRQGVIQRQYLHILRARSQQRLIQRDLDGIPTALGVSLIACVVD
jgi:hypothetical protein